MSEAYIEIGTKDSEMSISRMLRRLKLDMNKYPANSTDARIARALIDMMPGFIRTLDRERALMVGAESRNADGELVCTTDIVEELMFVICTPVINMVSSVIMTLVPCHQDDVCPKCLRLRHSLRKHMFDNMWNAVGMQLSSSSSLVGKADSPLTTAAVEAQTKKMH